MVDLGAEIVVLDASAIEALLGTELGAVARVRMRGCELHVPAHLDAEVLQRSVACIVAGGLSAPAVTSALEELAVAPIACHQLPGLLAGAWDARDRLRLVDALYVQLSRSLQAPLLTTDARLARQSTGAELVSHQN